MHQLPHVFSTVEKHTYRIGHDVVPTQRHYLTVIPNATRPGLRSQAGGRTVSERTTREKPGSTAPKKVYMYVNGWRKNSGQ